MSHFWISLEAETRTLQWMPTQRSKAVQWRVCLCLRKKMIIALVARASILIRLT